MIHTQLTARKRSYVPEYNSGIVLTEPSACLTVRQLLTRSLNGIPVASGNQIWGDPEQAGKGVPELYSKSADVTDFLNTRKRVMERIEDQNRIKRNEILAARRKDKADLEAFRKAAAAAAAASPASSGASS